MAFKWEDDSSSFLRLWYQIMESTAGEQPSLLFKYFK